MTTTRATSYHYNQLAKVLIEKNVTGSTREWLKSKQYTVKGVRFDYRTLDIVMDILEGKAESPTENNEELNVPW